MFCFMQVVKPKAISCQAQSYHTELEIIHNRIFPLPWLQQHGSHVSSPLPTAKYKNIAILTSLMHKMTFNYFQPLCKKLQWKKKVTLQEALANELQQHMLRLHGDRTLLSISFLQITPVSRGIIRWVGTALFYSINPDDLVIASWVRWWVAHE